MSQVWRGFYTRQRPQRHAHVQTDRIQDRSHKPVKRELARLPMVKVGAARTVHYPESTRAVLCGCGTQLAHASTDDTAERHATKHSQRSTTSRHPGPRGCPKTDQGHAAARTHGQTAQRTLAVGPRGCPRTDQGHAASRTHGQTANRRRSGHSEAKLRRRPSIQVGCQELRPRAAELVHKGGRVDGVLLHDAHKLRVETERQVAREHVQLLTHRLVL